MDRFFSTDQILVDLQELMEPREGLEINKLMDLTELIDCKDLMSAILGILEISSLFDVTLLILQFFCQGCQAQSKRQRLCLLDAWTVFLLFICFLYCLSCYIYFSMQVSSFLSIVFSFLSRFILLEQKALVSFTSFFRNIIFSLRILDRLTIDPLLLIQFLRMRLSSFRKLFALSV